MDSYKQFAVIPGKNIVGQADLDGKLANGHFARML